MTSPTLHKRQLNGLLREEFETLDAADRIAFFCECGNSECLQPVWLTGWEYDDNSAVPGWAALARGHRPLAEEAA